MSIIFKLCMLITSFLPLWISIIFIDFLSIFYMKDINIKTEIISIFLIFFILGLSIYKILKIKHMYGKRSYERVEITDIVIENKLTTEYLLSYILPLFAFDFTIWYECVKFLIYFFSVLLLCIKNNNVYINIFLELLNYKVYRCKAKFYTNDYKEIYVITKAPMQFKDSNTLEIIELNKPFYFYKEIEAKK